MLDKSLRLRSHGRMCAQVWASECAVEVAVPPMAASAVWSLNSTAALVATRLGTTLRYILQQHSMWHMAQVGDLQRFVSLSMTAVRNGIC